MVRHFAVGIYTPGSEIIKKWSSKMLMMKWSDKNGMMKKILGIVASAAFAATSNGFSPYVSIHGGWALQDDAEFDVPLTSDEWSSENGYVIGAAVGVAYDTIPVRTELDLSWQQNNSEGQNVNPSDPDVPVEAITYTGGGAVDLDQSMLIGMINGYYDIENASPITPFLMVGLGFAWVDVDNINLLEDGDADTDTDDDGSFNLGDTDDVVFAAQFGVGLSYAVSENIAIDLGYKYLIAHDAEFGYTKREEDGTSTSGDGDLEISGHQVQGGIRIMF